ncbi:hypothetical protein [Azospirillum sp. sgz302134]
MAQILSFPGKTQSVEASREEAARAVARRQLESASADFDRMMSHHAELQRQMAEFNSLCEQAMTERPSAEVICYPAFRAEERRYA